MFSPEELNKVPRRLAIKDPASEDANLSPGSIQQIFGH
jgi:hypothetical protein